jgi:hypothetical protein
MAQSELKVDTQAVALGRISEIARALSSNKVPATQFENSNIYTSVRSTIGGRAFWLAQVSEAARNVAAIQACEPCSGSTHGRGTLDWSVSLVPTRDRFLGFNVSSPALGRPCLRSKSSTLAVLGGLVGLISAVAITDVVPIGQFSLSDFWHQRPSWLSWLVSPIPAASQLEAELASASLVSQPSPEVSGNPASLGLSLRGKLDGAVVTLTGLLPGMEFSNGERIGTDAWRLTATDLGDVWVGPPDGFVGSIDIIAELRSPDDKVVDRQTVHLQWLPSTSQGFDQWQPDAQKIMPEQRKLDARGFASPSAEVSDLGRTYGVTRDHGETAHQQNWQE